MKARFLCSITLAILFFSVGASATPDFYATSSQHGLVMDNVSVTDTATNEVIASVDAGNVPELTPPVVRYSANPRYGEAPLTVTFKDNSTGSPYAWNWNFGDGTFSTIQNPKHTYSQAGNYSVTLTVTNTSGSNSFKKAKYIQVI